MVGKAAERWLPLCVNWVSVVFEQHRLHMGRCTYAGAAVVHRVTWWHHWKKKNSKPYAAPCLEQDYVHCELYTALQRTCFCWAIN